MKLKIVELNVKARYNDSLNALINDRIERSKKRRFFGLLPPKVLDRDQAFRDLAYASGPNDLLYATIKLKDDALALADSIKIAVHAVQDDDMVMLSFDDSRFINSWVEFCRCSDQQESALPQRT